MKKRMKKMIAVAMTMATLGMAAIPACANEEQYPLKGTFPYTLMTKEIVDKRLAEGWVFTGDPYADVGTATPFTNNLEWSQVNTYKTHVMGINFPKILITLAGLNPAPDPYSGSELTEEEEAIKNEVIKYLNSYDWKNASEYEKAYYTAEYIASRSKYVADENGGIQTNSTYAVLINGRSMCDGFAQTYHLLTRSVGLKSVFVSDYNHAWNYVMIDGQWYEMDISDVAQDRKPTDRADIISERYLSRPATDIDQYIWTEMGIELSEGDSTLPAQPMY